MTSPEAAREQRARGRKLNHIIEDHDDGYYEIDLTGDFVFFNQAIINMSGYSAAELKTLNSSELVASENLADVRQMFQDILAKDIATHYVETNFVRKDGCTIFVKMTAAVVKSIKLEPVGFHGFVRDITERRIQEEQQEQIRRQLDDSNESLEIAVANANQMAVEAEVANIELNQIFNTSLDGMWILDLNRHVLRANDTMHDMLGLSKEEIVGRKCYDVLAGNCCDNQECTVKRIKRRKLPVRTDIEMFTRGKPTPYTLTATPFYGLEHELVGVLENFRDITERKEAESALQAANDELQRLATLDGLTDIANRRSLDERLKHEWRRVTREKGELALIICDVDFFKKYNDAYGHQEGDECLKSVARALEAGVRRPADFVARYGGEEFAAILPNTDLAGAVCVAENIRRAVMELQVEHKDSTAAPVVTLSLGVACARPAVGHLPEILLTTADQALYRAKEAGRNRVASNEVVFPEGSNYGCVPQIRQMNSARLISI